MNKKEIKVDEGSAANVQVAGIRRLSSVVEQRFRNPEDSSSEGTPEDNETDSEIEVRELRAENSALTRAKEAAEEDAAAQRELNSALCRTVERLAKLARRNASTEPPFEAGAKVRHRSGLFGTVVSCTRGERGGWLVRVSFGFGDSGHGVFAESEFEQ